jgi:protein CpxP
VDDLKTYQEFTEVRLDGLKHLNSAFKSLYDAMTPEQKKNADMVFEKYTPSKPASQG